MHTATEHPTCRVTGTKRRPRGSGCGGAAMACQPRSISLGSRRSAQDGAWMSCRVTLPSVCPVKSHRDSLACWIADVLIACHGVVLLSPPRAVSPIWNGHLGDLTAWVGAFFLVTRRSCSRIRASGICLHVGVPRRWSLLLFVCCQLPASQSRLGTSHCAQLPRGLDVAQLLVFEARQPAVLQPLARGASPNSVLFLLNTGGLSMEFACLASPMSCVCCHSVTRPFGLFNADFSFFPSARLCFSRSVHLPVVVTVHALGLFGPCLTVDVQAAARLGDVRAYSRLLRVCVVRHHWRRTHCAQPPVFPRSALVRGSVSLDVISTGWCVTIAIWCGSWSHDEWCVAGGVSTTWSHKFATWICRLPKRCWSFRSSQYC